MNIDAVISNHNLPALRYLYDTIEVHVHGLRALGVSPESYGSLLTPVVLKKLPSELRVIVSRDMAENEWKLEPVLKVLLKEIG